MSTEKSSLKTWLNSYSDLFSSHHSIKRWTKDNKFKSSLRTNPSKDFWRKSRQTMVDTQFVSFLPFIKMTNFKTLFYLLMRCQQKKKKKKLAEAWRKTLEMFEFIRFITLKKKMVGLKGFNFWMFVENSHSLCSCLTLTDYQLGNLSCNSTVIKQKAVYIYHAIHQFYVPFKRI